MGDKMALSKEEILEAISKMSVMDVVDLISAMEEKFGVSAAVPAAATATVAAAEGAEETESKDSGTADLLLTEIGEKKVDVIKAVRTITGLGLKDAKALVDGAPSTIKEGLAKAEAQEYFKQLEEAGAKAELK